MPTFIETPEKVEAFQVPPENKFAGSKEVDQFNDGVESHGISVKHTEEGVVLGKADAAVTAQPGDWVVLNKHGGLFVWQDEAFKAKFTELWT